MTDSNPNHQSPEWPTSLLALGRRVRRVSSRMLHRSFQLGRIVARLVRGKHLMIWVGDSHSAYLNGQPDRHTLMHNGGDSFTWWLGPRLMRSLAENDFPARVRRAAKLAGIFRVGKNVTALFVSGEIDVRCHLAAPGNDGDMSFVATYVCRVRNLCNSAGILRCYTVVPVPPMKHPPLHPDFPIRGTIRDRVSLFEQLANQLHAAAGDEGYPEVIDATSTLSSEDGTMMPEFSDDNCHTNALGVTRFQSVLAAQLKFASK